MDKKEIKDYLKRVEELGAKLMGEDKETYTWLIYGYTQCAKLLNETEQKCKKQKEVIDNAIEYINDNRILTIFLSFYTCPSSLSLFKHSITPFTNSFTFSPVIS